MPEDDPCESDEKAEERKILEQRAKRRAELREYFQKEVTNPRRHATGEGGTVFDAGHQRYVAMKINTYDYFRPTIRNIGKGLGLVVLPMLAYGYWIQSDRNKREHMYRTGQVAYKDRSFKYI